jgi:hypothetical protein
MSTITQITSCAALRVGIRSIVILGVSVINAKSSAYSNDLCLTVSGEAQYEQYSPSGEIVPAFLSQSLFVGLFNTNAFRIDVIKLTGVHPNELPKTTLGWDGTNYYALATGKPYSFSKLYDRPGWPEDVSQARYVWLAYDYISVVVSSNLMPFPMAFFSEWVPYDKISMKFYPSDEEAKVDRIEFVAPGQYIEPKSRVLRPLAAPYGNGYVCAEFTMQRTNVDNVLLPASFNYSVYEVNPELPAEIGRYLVWAIRFNVTNLQVGRVRQTIAPNIVGDVIVSDYRYRGNVSNALQYRVRDALCLPYDAPKLKDMVNIRRGRSPDALNVPRRRGSVLVVLGFFALVPALWIATIKVLRRKKGRS